MKKVVNFIMIIALLVGGIGYPTTSIVAKSSKLTKVVEDARKNYYGTNKKIKKKIYKNSGVKGIYKEYMDKNGVIRKTLMYPGNGDMDVKGYTVEYYYNSNKKLVFAFAYKKVKGKKREYRAYYGTDGKLYRSIDTKGKVKNYKKGKEMQGNDNSMSAMLYSKGVWNIAVAYEPDFHENQ